MDKNTDLTAICVFCSSSFGSRPEYSAAAEELGAELASRSISLVYGGSNMGLMGCVARSVLDNGGKVTGIIPTRLQDHTKHLEVSDLLVVDTMHQRKQAMFDNSDAFIALPGGIGTLEETMEMLTWLQLGYSRKPVGLLNSEAYYTNLLKFLDTMNDQGMLKDAHRSMLKVADNAAAIVDLLQQVYHSSALKYVDKWG